MIRYGSQTAGKVVKGVSGAIANNMLKINIFEKVDKVFLYYYLNQNTIFSYLRNSQSSSTMPAITFDMLKNLEIEIPESIEEQKAIASVLSSLDDKIDLLHRQNKTLEAMAEALFRKWFIEEAKEDWKEARLGDVVKVKRGGSPRPIQNYITSKGGHNWLKISDATREESPFIFDIKEQIKQEGLNKTILLKKGSLVLSNSATPGIPKILQVDTCIHDGWLYFPDSYFSVEFLYLLFKTIRNDLLVQGNGSIFTNLKTDILKNYRIRIPPRRWLMQLQMKLAYFFEKILLNRIQIRTLENLRDTLLPKLMSGEVRVRYEKF